MCVLIAFLPAAIIGGFFIGAIKSLFFNPGVVAAALIIGGVIILLVESRQTTPHIVEMEQLSWRQAAGIGLAQCVAMIPGTSRSGATIVGGMLAVPARGFLQVSRTSGETCS